MLRYKSTDQNKFYTFNNKEIQNTIQLTGLIIVKNQEKYIIDSLHSLNTVCDRIVVVDTGSTDNTVKNIKNFFPNVELKHLEWRENYAYIRNAALNFVKDGWIFVLDSDETFQKMCTYDELHNFLGWLEIKAVYFFLLMNIYDILSTGFFYVKKEAIASLNLKSFFDQFN